VARLRKPAIELPPYVNLVRVKGRPYYYCHPGRGTENAKKPIRLPDDPRDPEFWVAYRRAMDQPEPQRSLNAVQALIEAYKAAPEWKQLAESTRVNWELYLKRITDAWRCAGSSQSMCSPCEISTPIRRQLQTTFCDAFPQCFPGQCRAAGEPTIRAY